jgi:predicted branched-subunit amino acid permease
VSRATASRCARRRFEPRIVIGSIALTADNATPAPAARTYRDGVRAIAPIAPMAAIFSASFGVLATAAGMGTVAPIVMSATTFAGSAQFAAVAVIGTGGALAAIGAAGLLNARYAPISLTVAPAMSGSFLSRLVQSQLIVDESWAVSQTGDGGVDRRVLVGAGTTLWFCWVGGTVVGVFGAELIGDPERFGLDAAFPALFLALLVPQLRDRFAVAAALLGAAIALALVPVSAAGIPIVAASAACLIGLARR